MSTAGFAHSYIGVRTRRDVPRARRKSARPCWLAIYRPRTIRTRSPDAPPPASRTQPSDPPRFAPADAVPGRRARPHPAAEDAPRRPPGTSRSASSKAQSPPRSPRSPRTSRPLRQAAPEAESACAPPSPTAPAARPSSPDRRTPAGSTPDRVRPGTHRPRPSPG